VEPEDGAGTGVAARGFPAPWTWTNPETGELVDSEALITDNLKLARKYAWGWARKSQMAYDDLEAIAFVGLVKGCRKFNPASGYKLSTIAVPYINGEILHHFRDRGYAVKFPARWREVMPRARRLLEAGEDPQAVCEAIGIDSGELEEMLGAMAGTTELHDELVGETEAQVELDVLLPVQHLVKAAWERLHQADRKLLEGFWSAPGRRPVFPTQALAQFLNAVRLALRGQRLPEIRKQLSLQLKVETVKPEPKQRRPRGRNRGQLEAQAVQLGFLDCA
jgi:RNA polymerase sigma factor (sigma-70 family)